MNSSGGVDGDGDDDLQLLSQGYQGAVYKSGSGSSAIIIKQPMGGSIARYFRALMIRREYVAYRRLGGIRGVPQCHGLRHGDRLELEFIDGQPLRDVQQQIRDPDRFYSQLLELVLSLHRAGVAHADLKRKDNILVTESESPFLIDFGSSIVVDERSGALRKFLFRQACRVDLNACIKLKYQWRDDEMSPEDLDLYRPTILEGAARRLRKFWRIVTARQWRNARRRRRDST